MVMGGSGGGGPAAVYMLALFFLPFPSHSHSHSTYVHPRPHSSPSQDHSSVLAAEEVLTVQRVLKTKGHTFSDEQVGMEGRGG